MINLSNKIQITSPEKIDSATRVILSTMAESIKRRETKIVEITQNKQYRKRTAILKLWRLISKQKVTPSHIDMIYQIASLSEAEALKTDTLYYDLSGHYPDMLEDVTGLIVGFKELLCILWSEKALTLPYTFDMKHLWKKNPDLQKHTYGFISQIAQGSNSLEVAARGWQYRTNWHAPGDVSFSEIWAAIPGMVNIQIGNSHKLSLLAWVKKFSATYPGIVSPDQAFYAERYQLHLATKRYHFGDASDHAMSYGQYLEHFALTPEESRSISSTDPNIRRHEIRKINKRYGYKQSKVPQKHKTIRSRLNAKPIFAKNGVQASDYLVNELSKSVSAEDYILFIEIPKREHNFDWISNDFYPGRGHIDIESNYNQWRTIGNAFIKKVNKPKNSDSYTNTQIDHIRFLFDYIFCYLPFWKEQHPESNIKLPETLADFERTSFWCDDLIDEETVCSIQGINHLHTEMEMPLTAIKLRELTHTKKTSSQFINSVHLFFEVVRTYGPAYGYVDGTYANPVNIKMDSIGSGGRSKSDKIPFPRDASIVAKAYMHSLDTIGIKLRADILNSRIDRDTVARIKSNDWLDLTELNLETTATVRSSKNPQETYTFEIKTVPNIYNWWLEGYFIPDTNRQESITVHVPWLSTLRMLAVGLFAGQRIQNGQWLDLRTFDREFNQGSVDCFNLCMLHVNTDKSGESRDAVIDGHVMASLFDERLFQTEVCPHAPGFVYYENDSSDPNEYGEICPLFRSPWGNHDLPFTDTTYSKEWIHFCRGLDQVYNSIVDDNSQHSFIALTETGKEVAVHVPHSLRAMWITHMRLYGHLEVTYAAQQAGHKVIESFSVSSDYYTVPTPQDMLENINLANIQLADSAYKALMGNIPSPSSPASAIVRGWSENRDQLIIDQKFRSYQFFLIDSQETGMDIIATTKTMPGFQSNCICMRGGDCHDRLLRFTGRSRVCSLCDASVYGVDHLPGINVCIRQAHSKSLALMEKICDLNVADVPPSDIEPYHHELSISRYELASYNEIASQLNKVLDDDNADGLIAPFRDLAGAKRHAIDMDNPRHRVIANILDSAAYPHLVSPNYSYMIERAAKSPDLLSTVPDLPSAKHILACQISSILRSTSLSADEIFEIIATSSNVLKDLSK